MFSNYRNNNKIVKDDIIDKPKAIGCPYMTDDYIERLKEEVADSVIEKLENKLYLRVGRGVVHKLLWLIGFATVSLLTWLHAKGII